MDLNLATTLIVRLVALIICILVTRYLLPWLSKKFKIAENVEIEFWTNTFVEAADQILGVHCGTNDEKYLLVANKLEELFPNVDPDLRNVLIEAAVKRLRNLEQKSEDVDS